MISDSNVQLTVYGNVFPCSLVQTTCAATHAQGYTNNL